MTNIYTDKASTYTIDSINGTITFYTVDNVELGTVKYFDGVFNFFDLENVPNIFFDKQGQEYYPDCSYIIVFDEDSDEYTVCYVGTDNNIVEIFNSRAYDMPILSHTIDEVIDGREPLFINGINIANFDNTGIEYPLDIENLFFNEDVIAEDIDNNGLTIVNIISNKDTLYYVDDGGTIYEFEEYIDVMGVYQGVILTPLGNNEEYKRLNGVVVADHFLYIENSKLYIIRMISNHVDVYDISTTQSVVSAYAYLSDCTFIMDGGEKITINGLNVNEVVIEPYTPTFNYEIKTHIATINSATMESDTVLATSAIDGYSSNIDFGYTALKYVLLEDNNMYTLEVDGSIKRFTIKKADSKDIRFVDNNDIFKPVGTLCDDGYFEYKYPRAMTINDQCFIANKSYGWGTAYGLNACDNFSICQASNIAVQIEKGTDKYMSIIDITDGNPMRTDNKFKTVKLKYNGAKAVAIWNQSIYVAFSDRIITQHNLLGEYQREYNLTDIINYEIQDITANCGAKNEIVCAANIDIDGLYILTVNLGTVYRFQDMSEDFCNSFKLVNHTDRTSFGVLKQDKVLASSVNVSSNRIIGFNEDGTFDPMYIIDSEEIVNMDIDENILYTLTAYYPYALSRHEI